MTGRDCFRAARNRFQIKDHASLYFSENWINLSSLGITIKIGFRLSSRTRPTVREEKLGS